MVITQEVPEFPETLYKYQSFEGRALENLENMVVFLSPKRLLNDPHELGFQLETYDNFVAKELELAKKREKHFNDRDYVNVIQKVLESEQEKEKYAQDLDYFSNAIDASGILSLTIDPTNHLMWTHYANSHSGFCLEFESDFLSGEGCALYPAEYMSDYPILSIAELRDWQYQKIAQSIPNCTLVSMHMAYKKHFNPLRFELSQLLLTEALLAKHESWKYEEEWRYIKGKSGAIKYDSTKLRSIIFGVASTNENIEKVKSILEAQTLSDKFKLKKVVKNPTNFGYEVVEI
ncbi:DUF2971 domain-containing protein [Vibrio parahaemolyticus]|nr:DUF2971 domain-containing protein [Vibrio parahaemolyticus]